MNALLSPLAQTPARILPPPGAVAPFPAAISQRLHYLPPADSREALIVLAVILGAIAFALSLLASLAGWLLIFLAPALGLAGWSCWQWWQQTNKAPREFKWLSAGIALLSTMWMVFYVLVFHVAH